MSSNVNSGVPGEANVPASAFFPVTKPAKGARICVLLSEVRDCVSAALACASPARARSSRDPAACERVLISSNSCGLSDFFSYSC